MLILETYRNESDMKVHLTDQVAINILPEFKRKGQGPPTDVVELEWNVITNFFVENIEPVNGYCSGFNPQYQMYPDYPWITLVQGSPTELYFNATSKPPGNYQFELRAYDLNDPLKFFLMNDTIRVYIHNLPLPPPGCPITPSKVLVVQDLL